MNDTLTTDATSVAAAFARAIAAGDRAALLGLLAPDVAFRAVTPARFWEIDAADAAVETLLTTWFGGDRHIDAIESIDTDTVADLARVGYRFRATTPAGPAVVEQQAYLGVKEGVITSVRIVCSGYRPVTD